MKYHLKLFRYRTTAITEFKEDCYLDRGNIVNANHSTLEIEYDNSDIYLYRSIGWLTTRKYLSLGLNSIDGLDLIKDPVLKVMVENRLNYGSKE